MKILALLSFLMLIPGAALAADETGDGSAAEQRAREAHQLASSDIIYQNEEWKALYYQNQQIIQLLKQIRDSLEAIRASKMVEN